MCYVETANLDGETNLKIRQGLPATSHLISRDSIRDWYLGCVLWICTAISCSVDVLGFEQEKPLSPWLTFFTFIILYNNLIPISLIITLDIVKYFQALVFINNDLDMYHEESDTPPRAQTSALNEELGQVQYIFSDKTGTLTQNEMLLLKCSVAGICYENNHQEVHACPQLADLHDIAPSSELVVAVAIFAPDLVWPYSALLDNLTNQHPTASVIREYLTLLAVCHTVVPERDRHDSGVIIYQAASPDESALVEAVKRLGFSFNVRQPESVQINALGRDEKYEILNVLEFNSTRKRMSVIVRTPHGKIKLYCKGADNVIYERLAPNQPFQDATTQHLKVFASDGLRTLCLAVAEIDEARYAEWSKVYEAAATALTNRAEKLDEAAEQARLPNLFLLGATAIEDRLQEGVPETIQALAQAGIKIWVCTGDKQETAINIGFSCRLLTSQMTLLVANEYTHSDCARWLDEQLQTYRRSDEQTKLAMIIDRGTLEFALTPALLDRWLELAKLCKAVIACRVSPLQKAEIVRAVKESEAAITLAIGDGANDVGMIQAAHVGVGISGKEGLQAARSADYSVGQFRFLKKLLLVHGAWSYRRITMLILYSFWKNIALYLMELWFAFDNGFSGQILFEKWTLSAYNVAFTLLPPLAIGVFDQHLSASTLMSIPSLYQYGQKRQNFNTWVFWGWTLNSIYHSLLLYWLPLEAFKHDNIQNDGTVTGQWFFGHVVYSIVIYTVILKAAMVINSWTKYTHIFLWGSVLIWIIFTLIYFRLWASNAFGGIGYEVYGVDTQMYRSALVWFSFLLFPVLALYRDAMYVALWTCVQRGKLGRPASGPRTAKRSYPTDARRKARLWTAHGSLFPWATETDLKLTHLAPFVFLNENTASVTQATLIRRYDTTLDKPEGE
ncbi:uncharacterized protein MONBRDRAFT_8524 [Monosiga brevicollis MX1]|uniref:Phospholipid-transporting ATPase n=1 Tax=Monosiga brevicollis TaxID=81824 RepID=A9V0A5_MONBE|nr:uncharacterized protein MONBRDRAFT_8524 [Monosiga brevicollis MX1]EDQ89125.1 predicted protein [Monosiga brevicollis MX1]|eukprot:XP_001746230.1 hypothetical protein [Monosiga brevicollis MX1]